MEIIVQQLPNTEKLFLVNLLFARTPSSDPFYRENRKNYYTLFSEKMNIKYNTITNNQDRLDALFDNGRKGWHQTPLEKQNKYYFEMYNKYKEISYEELLETVEEIKEIMTSTFVDKTFYSIKTKTPASVERILNKESDIEIEGINVFKDRLKVGQIIFVVLGGDKAKSFVTWETGLAGIGVIAQEPYDVGYEGSNFKIRIDMKIVLDSVMTREDLVPYANAYNIIGIGPNTKWEPNQAMSQIAENKTITLVRAILDHYPDLDNDLTRIFGEDFMMLVKAETDYLIPQSLTFGQKPIKSDPNEEKEEVHFEAFYDPYIEGIVNGLNMEKSVIETLRNYVNIGKHIIMTGPPGTGKTTIAEKVCEQAIEKRYISGYISTTATSDWSTFDTIGGYMPDRNGRLEFQEGIILRAIRENKWLIIDEINRAEIDKAFGQMFTVLSGKSVDLAFYDSTSGKSVSIVMHQGLNSYYNEAEAVYYIGQNWRIIGTMNTYDKNSLFTLSFAFMRRFAFINIPLPNSIHIQALIDSSPLEDKQKAFIGTVIKASPRPIGPAIINELIRYLTVSPAGFAEALSGSVVPQFEGVPANQIRYFYQSVSHLLSAEGRERFADYLIEFFDVKRSFFEKLPLRAEDEEQLAEDAEEQEV